MTRIQHLEGSSRHDHRVLASHHRPLSELLRDSTRDQHQHAETRTFVTDLARAD